MADPFGFNVAPGTSAESLALRRKMALELMSAGSSGEPIRSPWQGVNRIAQGITGGYDAYLSDQADKQRRADSLKLMSGLFGLGGEDATMPTPSSPAGGSRAAASGDWSSAISGIESGGRYDELGPVTKSGDRAYGKYQVMGANVGPWTKEVLGKEMKPQDFLASPDAQEAVFKGKFGQYAQKYGPEGAARAWFAGEGGMNDMGRKDQLGTSVADYAGKFNAATGGQPGELPPTSKNPRRMLRQAVALAANPDTAHLGNALLLKYLTENSDTTDTKEYALARQQGYKGSFLEYQKELKSASSRQGKIPVPMYDKEGNIVYGTIGAEGQWEPLKTPEGEYRAAPKATTKTIGGESVTVDAFGNVLSRQPIDLAKKEAEEAKGKIAGAAETTIPGVKSSVENAFETIGQLRNHPGLDAATGLTGVLPKNYIPGTDAYNFNELNKQAAAQSFMAARESLKGAGQVTDFEGAKGEAAIANLQRFQSKEQYLNQLSRLEKMMRSSYENLQEKARMGGQSGGRPIEQPAPKEVGPSPLSEARDAIARGAPRDAVIKRLQEKGIDPSGL